MLACAVLLDKRHTVFMPGSPEIRRTSTAIYNNSGGNKKCTYLELKEKPSCCSTKQNRLQRSKRATIKCKTSSIHIARFHPISIERKRTNMPAGIFALRAGSRFECLDSYRQNSTKKWRCAPARTSGYKKSANEGCDNVL